MNGKIKEIIEAADDIYDVSMCACDNDGSSALKLICMGIDERKSDEIAEELLAYWGGLRNALQAAAHRAAVKRWNKENVK